MTEFPRAYQKLKLSSHRSAGTVSSQFHIRGASSSTSLPIISSTLFQSHFHISFVILVCYLCLSPIISMDGIYRSIGLHSQATRHFNSASWCDRVLTRWVFYSLRRPFPGKLSLVHRWGRLQDLNSRTLTSTFFDWLITVPHLTKAHRQPPSTSLLIISNTLWLSFKFLFIFSSRYFFAISVSHLYLALYGIYRLLGAAFSSNLTRQQLLVVHQGPDTMSLSFYTTPLSREVVSGPSLKTSSKFELAHSNINIFRLSRLSQLCHYFFTHLFFF